MQNEELFDTSSEILDFLSDTAADTEVDPVAADDPAQGSDESAVTPVDTSSVYTVVTDNRDIIEEMQRIEGYTISILYMLYIALAFFISVVIVKMIYHFSKFN